METPLDYLSDLSIYAYLSYLSYQNLEYYLSIYLWWNLFPSIYPIYLIIPMLSIWSNLSETSAIYLSHLIYLEDYLSLSENLSEENPSHPSIHPSIHLIDRSVRSLSVCLSINHCLSVCQNCLSVCLSEICLSIYSSLSMPSIAPTAQRHYRSVQP